MKRPTGLFYLIALLLGLCLAACAPDAGSGTATAVILPTATNVTLPTATTVIPTQPIATLTPTQPPTSTPTPPPPSPTMTPAPQSRAVSFNGIHFTYDPALGDVYTRTESIGEVAFDRFSFAPDGLCRQVGCVDVYPLEQYEAAFPDRPLPPLGAATVLRAQDQPLSFHNGGGVRSIRMRGQAAFFANNEALVYDFQGYTDDSRYYVLVIIPIDAPILLSAADPDENTNAAAIPVPAELPSDYGQLGTVVQEYNQEAARQLDQLAAADFTPGLDALDALVASLVIEKPPDEETLPPSTEAIGPFQRVSGLPAELSGDVTSLRTGADGRLWIATTYSYGVWQDGQWQTTPTDFRIRNVLPTRDGTIWLASNLDIFIFDGVRWTILTPSDMDMTPPLDPDFFTPYVLERVGEQVWVGRCDWGGPGPMGGGGARWYDGTSWQGADSPVATGCVTAIRADDQGRVWVAANTDLWRYDPAADVWDHFAPPEPPEGYRFGFISDLAFDPAGGPWPLYDVCGGASCGQIEMRYRLDDGAWVLVREEIIFPQRLVFDSTGVPWLFYLNGAVYRFHGDPSADALVADFIVDAVTTDADGRVWVAGGPVMGETAVWLLEPDTALSPR